MMSPSASGRLEHTLALSGVNTDSFALVGYTVCNDIVDTKKRVMNTREMPLKCYLPGTAGLGKALILERRRICGMGQDKVVDGRINSVRSNSNLGIQLCVKLHLTVINEKDLAHLDLRSSKLSHFFRQLRSLANPLLRSSSKLDLPRA